MSSLSSTQCSHSQLCFQSSPHVDEVGYRRPTLEERKAARTQPPPKRRSKASKSTSKPRDAFAIKDESISTFPLPLVLPGDDIALDPTYPSQSLDDWINEEDRNKVTPRKNVVYLAVPPDVHEDVEFVRQWSIPRVKSAKPLPEPDAQDVLDYLSAFYHGLPVKILPRPLSFGAWEDDSNQKKSRGKDKPAEPRYVGLNIKTESVRIRTRVSPDGLFKRQLNLDDLLDAAISLLPKDAYALLLLVKQDLYEDDDDLFTCGRAYGGSRVAVVSTARYNPTLDSKQNVNREHSWPASHCQDYISSCANASRPKKKPNINPAVASDDDLSSPLQAALSAHKSLSSLELFPTADQLSGLWLGRVCRTGSHELGHCFGIDHCMYYACSMQGSASLAEDARQPPYLCPIDLAKILRATGSTAEERYLALLSFCKKHQETHLFAAFGAWISGRLQDM
ncbi:hypothetical protein FQN50_006072 [Emmonsiellopsis sp. PD_5]|nr:hypothetical protein FQN50_006072 [Emmonsiellopsis sp. PD_5]